jgi:flagellar biosynthesis/type III secretory pathway ATPase
LISITDGQIVLSPTLFGLGVLPAVDVGPSVSRVGGKAQRAAYRAVTGDLKLAYAQFEELETFARFGARLDEDTRLAIAHGQRIRAGALAGRQDVGEHRSHRHRMKKLRRGGFHPRALASRERDREAGALGHIAHHSGGLSIILGQI